MKIIKKILLVIVLIIAIGLIMALFIKKEYTVEREITINKPKQEVFDYIKIAKNQEYYNKWWMMDPNISKQFRGTDGTEGFVAAWDSKNNSAGKGEQEIKKITEGERIDYELRFKKPFEATCYSYMTTEAVGNNQTKVKWVFNGRNGYPMNFMNLFMNGMLGKDLNKSLENLKKELEK